MTFRVPLTSSGVDTAAAGQAGVKVYEAGVPGAYYGVVEFRDGYRDDSPAQIIGRATAARSDTSAATGGLELHGGVYAGGVVAPELDLLVTPGSDGVSPTTVARLKGAQIIDLGAVCEVHATDQLTGWTGGSWFVLPLGTVPAGVDIDSAGAWNSATWTWTCPATATYALEGMAQFASIPAGAWVCARLEINGAPRPGSTGAGVYCSTAGGAVGSTTGRRRYALNKNDTVRLAAFSTATLPNPATLAATDGRASFLLIERVG